MPGLRVHRLPKIKVRKRFGWWFVLVPGDVPDFSKHAHFTDALAKVFFELRDALAKALY
jgi:hypothetical protein